MLVRYAAIHVSLGTDCGVQISVVALWAAQTSPVTTSASHFSLALADTIAEVNAFALELKTLFGTADAPDCGDE